MIAHAGPLLIAARRSTLYFTGWSAAKTSWICSSESDLVSGRKNQIITVSNTSQMAKMRYTVG
jgi:hypothetical protein